MPHRVQPPGRINRVCGAAGGEGALAILSNSHTKNSCSGLAASAHHHESSGGSPGGLVISCAPDPRAERTRCLGGGLGWKRGYVWRAFGGMYVFWMFRLTLIKADESQLCCLVRSQSARSRITFRTKHYRTIRSL